MWRYYYDRKKKNVEMYDMNGVYICTFKTLRGAANCLVAMGLAENYKAAKINISRVVHKAKDCKSAYGFTWDYAT